MKILVVALGTRGDVQPMIALSRGLQDAGHSVTLIAGENFATWVRSHGLNFAGTLDMEALMQSSEGVAWVESPKPRQQLQHMKSLLHPHAAEMYTPIIERAPDADVLISGFVSAPFVQAIAEKFGTTQINAPLQPYLATRSGAASLSPLLKGRKSLVNRWVGAFAERLIWSVAAETTNDLRTRVLGLPAHTVSSFSRVLHQMPTIYGFSPRVVPPPDDWGKNVHIAGYWFLHEQWNWQPPGDLVQFLEDGTPPIYIGFGSMSSGSPRESINLICTALEKAGQRAVIASGWSGAAHVRLPAYAFAIDSAPHDWLFERVAGVVHHGGAGTTAAGLRAGKPTLVIPHFSDQPFWGRRVYELGAGPQPIPRQKLTVDNLAQSIDLLVRYADIRIKAAELGEQIRSENGVQNAVELIEQMAAKK